MPSLVTDNFRMFAAQQFIESLEEPYIDTATPPTPASDDPNYNAIQAAASQAFRSKIYLFIGRSQNWNDNSTLNAVTEKYEGFNSISDLNPPSPVDSIDELSEIYDDMIALKRVTRSDVCEVVRKKVWQRDIVYDMYKDDYGTLKTDGTVKLSSNGQSKLYNCNFYVMNSQFQVFKCIYNGQSPINPSGAPSTVEPTGTSTSIITLSDGYRWKYMYTITIPDYIKFVSTDFMPVRIDSIVKAAAVNGSIEQVILDNAGSGFNEGSLTKTGTYANTAGSNTITITCSGHGLSNGDQVYIDFTGNGTANDGYFTVSNADTGAFTVIAPSNIVNANNNQPCTIYIQARDYYVPVNGDGGSGTPLPNDTSRCIVKITVGTSSITSTSIYQPGTGYSYGYIDLSRCYFTATDAKSQSTDSTKFKDFSSKGCKLTLISSPPGGHGSNALYELGAYRIMINKSLDFLDGEGDIPVDMQFRRFGLIEDPQRNGSTEDYIINTATACKAIKFQPTFDSNFIPGEIITQPLTGATGRVIHWDSINKVLRYYQNEYISGEKQTGTSKYNYIAFSGNSPINGTLITEGGSGIINAIPDISFSNNNLITQTSGIVFSQGYSISEIKKFSGQILYVENRKPVVRSNDQIEDVKLVIEF